MCFVYTASLTGWSVFNFYVSIFLFIFSLPFSSSLGKIHSHLPLTAVPQPFLFISFLPSHDQTSYCLPFLFEYYNFCLCFFLTMSHHNKIESCDSHPLVYMISPLVAIVFLDLWVLSLVLGSCFISVCAVTALVFFWPQLRLSMHVESAVSALCACC